jgi:2-phospho-L-lactate/phosphoenolpyruvate guanylyltransferase
LARRDRLSYKIAVRAVLIAAKELSLAKSRLGAALPGEERAALAEAMLRDVLASAMGARAPALVAVVTSDRALLAIARMAGALAIDEQFPRGLNVAVRFATRELIARGAREVATVLSDIPLTTASDIDAAFAAIPGHPGVVLVPSRDFTGTNIIVRTPPGAVVTRFGRQSLSRHLEECRRAAIACEVMRMMRPAIDLDLPGDLLEFARTPSPTRTFNALARLGIVHGKASLR